MGGEVADVGVVVVEEGVERLVDGEEGFCGGGWSPEGEVEGFGSGVARVEGLGLLAGHDGIGTV